jgi:hypothetical protein
LSSLRPALRLVSTAFFVLLASASAALYLRSGISWFLGEGMGSDYTYFLPRLLYGYFWFHENGIAEVPWYSPAWCAGMPYFANPQVMYYAVPQFLLLWADPKVSILLTFLIFGYAGAIAMYLLLRRAFAVGVWLALLGAVLFLFNEFYLSRMAVGHLTYHMFPLIPLVVLLVVASLRDGTLARPRAVSLIVANALVIACFVYGGAANFVIPAMLSVACVLAIYVIRQPRSQWLVLCSFAISSVLAVMLSLSKIVAAYSFMRWFPRETLNIGLFDSLRDAVFSSFTMLFMNPWIRMSEMAGQYLIQSHELRFGVGIVPLLMFPIALFCLPAIARRWTLQRSVLLLLMLLVMALPVVLSVKSDEIQAFLKALPYFRESSLILRWLALEIPIVIVLCCVLVHRVLGTRSSAAVAVFGIVLTGLSHLAFERPNDARYSASTLVQSYQAVRAGAAVPDITQVVYEPPIRTFIGLGDQFTTGTTGLYCYEAIFGYRLEKYPRNLLQPGDVMSVTDQLLNLKNPACYVYPEENGCAPGDHFAADEVSTAERFVSMQPIELRQSSSQTIANWISLLTLAGIAVALLGMVVGVFFRRPVRVPSEQ